MINTKLAKKVLTKKEQNHLTRVGGIGSVAAMKRQVEYMKKLDPESPGSVCWDCWSIARKLGIIK